MSEHVIKLTEEGAKAVANALSRPPELTQAMLDTIEECKNSGITIVDKTNFIEDWNNMVEQAQMNEAQTEVKGNTGKDWVFPSTPKDVERIAKSVRDAANVTMEIDTLKEDLKTIGARVQEDTGMPKALFNKHVSAYLDKEKVKDEIEVRQDILDNLKSI